LNPFLLRQQALDQQGLKFRREAARGAEPFVQVAGDLAWGLELRGHNGRPVGQLEELHLDQALLARAGAEVEYLSGFDTSGERCPEQSLAGVMRAERREE